MKKTQTFQPGDKVRLKDGDGRTHIIKEIPWKNKFRGEGQFAVVIFEDNTAKGFDIEDGLLSTTPVRRLAKAIAREPNPEKFKALVRKYRNELSECTNDRIVNELWRDKYEHWSYNSIHYRSGKNFRSLEEWWKVPSFKVEGDDYHEWRLVYRRGRVYRSRCYANSFGRQIMLYGNKTGKFLCFCSVTGCAPVERIE